MIASIIAKTLDVFNGHYAILFILGIFLAHSLQSIVLILGGLFWHNVVHYHFIYQDLH